mmetsp:Transcript_28257/g.87422  ORF Transcript_28257/g.87422 Transcript_28257/m.87422 type:complete len:109 (+) Transcript_28257:216-542(+)
MPGRRPFVVVHRAARSGAGRTRDASNACGGGLGLELARAERAAGADNVKITRSRVLSWTRRQQGISPGARERESRHAPEPRQRTRAGLAFVTPLKQTFCLLGSPRQAH